VLYSARPGASKAIFLITDGFSNGGDPRPEARRIRESGVKIFTVGIAKGNKEELWDMSSEPKNETCYILDSFEEFESLARRALHEGISYIISYTYFVHVYTNVINFQIITPSLFFLKKSCTLTHRKCFETLDVRLTTI
jgi:hypothetical protein